MAQSKTEFELKLTGPIADISAVPRLPWLDKIAAGPGAWERLVSTYYDSKERRLANEDLSLRVRDEADGRVLTAKLTPRGGSSLCRLESERTLAGDEFSFRTGVAEFDSLVGAGDDLEAIARTTTDRWRRYVETKGALVELSAEIGFSERFIDGRADQAPLCEIEIELLKGDLAAPFHLAEKLIAGSGGRLRLSVETKLDRALRAGVASKLGKAPRTSIESGMNAGDVLAAALRQCAVRIVETAALAVDRRDGDAARQLRVALRRLRAVEKAFRAALDDDALGDLPQKAKSLATIIGAVRDIDLFIAESLPLASAPEATSLRSALEAERAQLWNDATIALTDESFGAFSVELFRAAWLEPWRASARKTLAMPAKEFADGLLTRRFQKLLAGAAGADFSDPPTLHPLRIDLKKFRYAVQFLRELYAEEARKPFLAAMSALQDSFGAVSDAVVAGAIAESAGAGKGPQAARAAGVIAGYRGTQALATAAAAEPLWRAFAAMPPYWGGDDSPVTDGP